MLRISLLYTTRDLRSLRSSVRGRHGRLFSFFFWWARQICSFSKLKSPYDTSAQNGAYRGSGPIRGPLPVDGEPGLLG
jgi:hypothetical protein